MPHLQIVTNDQTPKHNRVILDLLASATKVWVFAAYLGNKGIEDIESALKAMCARKVELELYCGLSQYVSHPDAIRRLFTMCEGTKATDGTQTARLYLCEAQHQIFHPKMYCFFSDAGLTLLIGSANLTAGGMTNNVEVSAVQSCSLNSDTTEIVKAFRKTTLKTAKEADGPRISRYKRRYDIYHRERDKAQKQAEKQIREIHELKSVEIENYLNRYHKAGKDAEFKRRKARYREARDLLDEIADTPHLRKSQFLRLYSELVGGGQKQKRWTSSSIWRSKSEVVRHYPKVVSLIRLIRANSAKSPEEVFRIGRQHTKSIPGFGVNLLTEVMHTFGTDKFALLNNNPLTSLKEFGYESFRPPNSFKPEQYAYFNSIIADFKKWGLKSIAQADQFLSYVYGQEKKKRRKRKKESEGQ